MAVCHAQLLFFAYFSFVCVARDGMTASYLLRVLTVCLAQERHIVAFCLTFL